MKITRSTKWAAFAPFATVERIAQIKEKITDCAIFDFWGMTIGEFSQMLDKGLPARLEKELEKDVTVYDVVKILNACEKFLKEFEKSMKILEVPLDADEERAAGVMLDSSPIESMLNFSLTYFGQHPVKGGYNEEITLLEYRIKKKDVYNSIMYQKKLTYIQTHKPKK